MARAFDVQNSERGHQSGNRERKARAGCDRQHQQRADQALAEAEQRTESQMVGLLLREALSARGVKPPILASEVVASDPAAHCAMRRFGKRRFSSIINFSHPYPCGHYHHVRMTSEGGADRTQKWTQATEVA